MSSDTEKISQPDAYDIAALQSARARRADHVNADLALSAASTRLLALSDEVGSLERQLARTRAELAEAKVQLEQSQRAPVPGRLERLERLERFARRLLHSLRELGR